MQVSIKEAQEEISSLTIHLMGLAYTPLFYIHVFIYA